jgi:hypothetical protein
MFKQHTRTYVPESERPNAPLFCENCGGVVDTSGLYDNCEDCGEQY